MEYFPWWFEDPDYENSEIEDSVYLYSKAIEKLTGVADLISLLEMAIGQLVSN